MDRSILLVQEHLYILKHFPLSNHLVGRLHLSQVSFATSMGNSHVLVSFMDHLVPQVRQCSQAPKGLPYQVRLIGHTEAICVCDIPWTGVGHFCDLFWTIFLRKPLGSRGSSITVSFDRLLLRYVGLRRDFIASQW